MYQFFFLDPFFYPFFWLERDERRRIDYYWKILLFPAFKVREQMEAERRRGEAELRGEMRREVDKLREEVAEVQVMIKWPSPLENFILSLCI